MSTPAHPPSHTSKQNSSFSHDRTEQSSFTLGPSAGAKEEPQVYTMMEQDDADSYNSFDEFEDYWKASLWANLTTLSVQGCKSLTFLPPFPTMPSLTSLNISSTCLPSCSLYSFSGSDSLAFIDISNNRYVKGKDIWALSHLANVKVFKANRCRGIQDAGWAESWANLETFELSATSIIKVPRLVSLVTVNFSHNPQLQELPHFPHLRSCNVASTRLGSNWVRGLWQCEKVDVSGLDLDYTDVEALHAVKVLKVNRITNVLRRPEVGEDADGSFVKTEHLEARYCGATDSHIKAWRWSALR